MKTLFRILPMVILLGFLPSSGKSQTLAEVLRAVQRRSQLIDEMGNVNIVLLNEALEHNLPPPIDPLPLNEIVPIDWGYGLPAFPSDDAVDGLPVKAQVDLLNQAWSYTIMFGNSYFYDPRCCADGVGIVEKMCFDSFLTETTLGDYRQRLLATAASLSQMKMVRAWGMGLGGSAMGHPSNYDDGSGGVRAQPDRPQPPLTVKGNALGTGDPPIYNASQHSGSSVEFYCTNNSDSTAFTFSWRTGYYSSFLNRTPLSFRGNMRMYSSLFPDSASTIVGLPPPISPSAAAESISNPGQYLIAREDSIPADTERSIGLPRAFNGNWSGVIFPGSWTIYIPDTPLGEPPNSSAPTSILLPKYDGNNVTFTRDDITKHLRNRGTASYALFSDCYFVADFGTEFSSVAKPLPERISPLEIIPDFGNNRLTVKLAEEPANQCKLMWNFLDDYAPAIMDGALAAHRKLGVQGSGNWEAVYSGRTEDREPQLRWNGSYGSSVARWANFPAYLADWWQPVLTQLKTATYCLDITQESRFKYRINFYRADQFGAKDATTGRYTINSGAAPVETFTVENPAGDDAQPGMLKITTTKQIYNLTLEQEATNEYDGNTVVSRWTLHEDDLVSGQALMDKEVETFVDPDTGLYTVADTTSVDGQAVPKVTTAYWPYDPYTPADPADIDNQTEEAGGEEGTRTTSYTYEGPFLTGITQTGGTNPFSATYSGTNPLLTSYVCGPSRTQIAYDGDKVTETETFNQTPVRTLVTTYSAGLSTSSTVPTGVGGAVSAETQFYPGDDDTHPWGLKLVRGFDGALTTYSYGWTGRPGASDLVTTVKQGPEAGDNPGTVAAGTQTIVKTNGAGQVYSTVATDLESGSTLDFATATDYQTGTPFPSAFSHPLGAPEQFVYDPLGRITSHTDQFGLAQSFTLDALGRVTQSTRGALTWNIYYNPTHLGRYVTVSDGQSTRSRDEYTSAFGSDQAVTITGPENTFTERQEDVDTITTTTQNDSTSQNLSETVHKDTMASAITGNVTEPWNTAYTFPGGGWTKTITHGTDGALSAKTSCDALGRVTGEDVPSPGGTGRAVTTYAYDNGRLASATDPVATTSYSYQPDGSLGKISRGGRSISVARYDADAGQIGWQWTNAAGETLWRRACTPATGVTVDYPWGESARAVTSTPGVASSVLSVATAGPEGAGNASWDDGVPVGGSLTRGAASAGWTALCTAFGDMTRHTLIPGNDPANALTTSFDVYGWPSGITGLVTATQANGFDDSGNFSSQLSRNGHLHTRSFSSQGDDLGTAGYGLPDAPWSPPSYADTVTRTLTTGAGSAQFTYSLAGTLLQRQFPDGSAEGFAYDANGGLVSKTDAAGATLGYAPNAFGEPTQIGAGTGIGYDAAGRVNTLSNAADTSVRTYTEGQLHTEEHTAGVLKGQALERDYDSRGRLRTVRLPGGVSITYAYSGPNGALSGVTTAGGLAGTWDQYDPVTGRGQSFHLGALSTTSGWDGLGRNVGQASTAAGVTSTYTHHYDADGHCEHATSPEGTWTYRFDGGKGWLQSAVLAGRQSLGYDFDEAGRLAGTGNATDYRPTKRLNSAGVAIFGSVTPGATLSVNNTAASVDAVTGQFNLSLSGVPAGWQTYTTRGVLAHAGTGGTAAVAESVNQVFVPPATEALAYDGNGNRNADARWSQEWNALGQMTSMSDAASVSAARASVSAGGASGALLPPSTRVDCLYDLSGRRVQKTVSVDGVVSKRTVTLWDGWRPVLEIDYAGTGGGEIARRYYTWGPDASGSLDGAAGIGGLLEIVEKKGAAVSVSLPIYDGIGNVVGLVDAGSGERVATYQYGPFGEVLGMYGVRAASCPLRYQTKLYDEETALSIFGKRVYDARTGTWASRDPLREAGGVNLYAYCNNDPVGHFDPIGLDSNGEEDGSWEYYPESGEFGWVSDYNRYYFGGEATLTGRAKWSYWDTHPIDQPIHALGGRSLTMVFGTEGARAMYGGAELLAGSVAAATPGVGPYLAARSATESWMEFSQMEPGPLKKFTGLNAATDSLGALLYLAGPLASVERVGTGSNIIAAGKLRTNPLHSQAGSIINPLEEFFGDSSQIGMTIRDTAPGVRAPAIHHIATDKNAMFALEFGRLFEDAGIDLQHPLNKILLENHVGPHGYYNQIILRRLQSSVIGVPPGTANFRAKLIGELFGIRSELADPISPLRGLLNSPASSVEINLSQP